jgi:hypothetical protein
LEPKTSRVVNLEKSNTLLPTLIPLSGVGTIDLVLIDPQSVGKRTHDLMDTVNAKKRWKTIFWRVNKYLKQSHLLTRLGKEQASF